MHATESAAREAGNRELFLWWVKVEAVLTQWSGPLFENKVHLSLLQAFCRSFTLLQMSGPNDFRKSGQRGLAEGCEQRRRDEEFLLGFIKERHCGGEQCAHGLRGQRGGGRRRLLFDFHTPIFGKLAQNVSPCSMILEKILVLPILERSFSVLGASITRSIQIRIFHRNEKRAHPDGIRPLFE